MRGRHWRPFVFSISDTQLSLVRSANTAGEAWSKLENHYEVKSLANKLFLRKRYFTATMSENDTMMERINKMRCLAEQMASVGAQVSENDHVVTLLCSLPDSYNNLIVALESRANQLTLELIIARLLHEERKRSEASSDLGIAMEKALVTTKEMSRVAEHQVKSTNKKGECYNCGLKGLWQETVRNLRSQAKGRDSKLMLQKWKLRMLCFGQQSVQTRKKLIPGLLTLVDLSTCHGAEKGW